MKKTVLLIICSLLICVSCVFIKITQPEAGWTRIIVLLAISSIMFTYAILDWAIKKTQK